MDRQIVYVGAVPLDTDQLQQSRSNMVALGYLAKAVIGDNRTVVDGLTCLPGSGLSVSIGPGTIFAPDIVDAGYYGALPPDGDPLLKTGINTSSTVLPVVAGATSIISASLAETLTGDTVVAYYNPANPSQTLFGPQADGQSQATILAQRVSLVASLPSAVPSGNIPLWQIVVPANAAAVTSGMIAAVPAAPFIPVKLPYAAPLNSPTFTGVPAAPTPGAGDASTSLATTAFVAAAVSRNRAAWGTGGSYAWTCPIGVINVLARLWGAGGKGGAGGGGPGGGGGGGGGGYIEVLVTVTPGQSYAVQVGSGTSTNRTTAFDALASVGGGSDGVSGTSGGPGTGGACGGAASSPFSLIAALGVTAGSTGFSFAGAAVGGAGGSSFGISGTGATFVGAGNAGTWPGGGGAGGAAGTGGNGADGLVILEWLG